MANPKSNEVLTYSMENIEKEIIAINKKLDTKFVSHETFELVITDLRKNIDVITSDLSDVKQRTANLENWRWYMVGMGAVGVILIPIITTLILRNI